MGDCEFGFVFYFVRERGCVRRGLLSLIVWGFVFLLG